MGFTLSYSATVLCLVICYGGFLPGDGIQYASTQRLPPQTVSRELPIHLPSLSSHQSGYLILPKSSLLMQKNNGHPQANIGNRKPARRPSNIPPGKIRPPSNRDRPPNNNPPFNQQAGSHQMKHILPNGQMPQRNNNYNPQFLDATIPQNIKPEHGGQNRPPILPNFQMQPPRVPNHQGKDLHFNNLPPLKPNKMKNRPKNVPIILPTSDIEGSHLGDLAHELNFKTSILPQMGGHSGLDIADILRASHKDNELLQEQPLEKYTPTVLDTPPQINAKSPQFPEKNPGHELYGDVQSGKAHAEPLKQSGPEKNFHIPFPDFAESEKNPSLQTSNFPNLNVNNMLSAQESKQAPIAVRGNDVFDHINDDSESVSLYGQVLPPNDATYSSDINNFPGVHDNNDEERWPVIMPEMPKIIHLDVKCEKNLMRVSIDFDKPFHGIIYSKGHYSYGRCVHLPGGSGHNSVHFDISINSCGMQGSSPSGHYGPTETGSYFENTVVVQYDPLVQEVWDQARKLRCNWHDQYEKTVTFRPFNVDMLQVVRADFAGDNVGCWMQIQVGKGPWANEVAGIVRIGQTMTLVLAIKDEENKFDMMVRNCIAHDGNKAPIELVDTSGCVTRPKLMSRFTKVKNFGSSASVLSFAHFQAFKFPDSTEVHIQCTVQICRQQCEDQCRVHRRKRQAITGEGKGEVREIGLNQILQVVAVEDLTFSPYKNETDDTTKIITEKSRVCMSSSGFAASLILLLSIIIISTLIAAFLFLQRRNDSKLPNPSYDMPTLKKYLEKQSKKQQQTVQQKRV